MIHIINNYQTRAEFLASNSNLRGDKTKGAIKNILMLIVVDNMKQYDKNYTRKTVLDPLQVPARLKISTFKLMWVPTWKLSDIGFDVVADMNTL